MDVAAEHGYATSRPRPWPSAPPAASRASCEPWPNDRDDAAPTSLRRSSISREVLLIDGNSLTYRAFLPCPTDMATASGQVTNAVFGFTSMLINLLRDHRPDRIVVSFDLPDADVSPRAASPTTRRAARRRPDILRQQMGLVRQVIETLAIPIVETEGFEADDVLATLATAARDAGDDVIVVTGDRDVYQLVEDPHVKVLYNKRGVSRLRLLRRGRHHRAHRGEARPTTSPTRRCAVTRPTTCPASPAWARRRRPSWSTPTAASTASTRISTTRRRSCARTSPRPRSQVRLQRRGDGPRPRRRRSRWASTISPMGEIDVDAVRKLFDFLEFRTLYDRLAEVLDRPLERRRRRTSRCSRPNVVTSRPPRRRGAARRARRGDTLLAVAPGWRGDDERAELEGLALVTDAADRRGRLGPVRSSSTMRRCSPRSRRWSRGRASARRSRHQGAGALAVRSGARRHRPGARHPPRRLSARPGREPLPARRAAGPLRRP